jgi:nucleotide-binding universal stress UspA family protein
VDNSESLSVQSRSGAYLKELAETLRRLHGVSVRWDTPMGTSIAGTLRSLCQTDARALVIARPRRSAASRFWWGSVTDGLIGRLAVPLLIVPNDAAAADDAAREFKSGFSRVLVHMDGTEMAEDVLEHAASVASAGAVCHLLRVLPLTSLYATGRGRFSSALDQRNEAWRKLFRAQEKLEERRFTARPRLILDGQTAASAIVEQARAMQAQLIVLGARQHLPWWLRDGIAEYVVRHSTIPVLLVPENRRVGNNPIVPQPDRSHVNIHFN